MKVLAILIIFFITQANSNEEILSQGICDENEIEKVNDVKRTVENNLIYATSISKTTDNSVELLAFYSEGKLLKITATSSVSVSEQIFFNSDSQMVYYERFGYSGGKEFFEINYFRGNALFCRENGLNGEKVNFSRKAGQKILDVVEKYLLEIQ